MLGPHYLARVNGTNYYLLPLIKLLFLFAAVMLNSTRDVQYMYIPLRK